MTAGPRAGQDVANLKFLYTAGGSPKVSGGEIVQTLVECAKWNNSLDITLGDASNLSKWFVWKEGRGFYMRYGFREVLQPHLFKAESLPLCGSRPEHDTMNFKQLWEIVQESRQTTVKSFSVILVMVILGMIGGGVRT